MTQRWVLLKSSSLLPRLTSPGPRLAPTLYLVLKLLMPCSLPPAGLWALAQDGLGLGIHTLWHLRVGCVVPYSPTDWQYHGMSGGQ